MPGWLDAFKTKQEDQNKKDDSDDLELKAFKDNVAEVPKIKERLSVLDDVKKTSDRMNSFLDEQEAAKRKRQADELAKKAQDDNKKTEDELDELALTDPRKAAELIADAKTKPIQEALINTQSVIVRKQIFDDNPGKYEYYTNDNPEFKAVVDKYINELPINARTNASAIENCYAVAAFQKSQEIKEGKLKSRFAAISTNSNGSKSTSDKDTVTLSDAQKRAAEKLGIKEEDYAKEARDMHYV